MLATIAQRNINQMRSFELYISSILPATTIVGIADKNPEKNRPTATPAREGTRPTITQKILYKPVLMMYSLLRPNASEKDGNMIPPAHWPSKYLYIVTEGSAKSKIWSTPRGTYSETKRKRASVCPIPNSCLARSAAELCRCLVSFIQSQDLLNHSLQLY